MAELTQRSDRSDQNRYQSLNNAANDDKVRSPGWTNSGDMQSHHEAANKYDKAAQDHSKQQHAAKSPGAQSQKEELTDKQKVYLQNTAQALGPSQKDRGQDRAQEQQRSRGQDLSR